MSATRPPGPGGRTTRPHRALRLLLRALPGWLRERHGAELLAFWDAQRVEPRYRGAGGRLRWALHVVRDALATGLRARLRGAPGRRRPPRADALLSDVRWALRTLPRSPLYAVVSVVTLALGIGATTALFTVVRGVLLRPLPYPEPERLVRLVRMEPDGSPDAVAWLDFVDWREQAGGFDGMAAYTDQDGVTFGWDDGAEAVDGARVTRNLFEVLGVPPALGRTFTEAEDAPGGPPAVILSHGLWQARFGGDPGVLGRTVPMDGEAVPVVGVAPAGLAFPGPGVRFWRPLQSEQVLVELGFPVGTRTLSFLDVVARVGAGGREAAAAELVAVATRIDTGEGKDPPGAVRVEGLLDTMVGDVRTTLTFLLAAGALVLLVACANVASLALSRGAAREREMAVRTALGAGRGRLARQLLTESLALAGVAGACAAGLTWGLTRVVLAVAPPGLPRLGEVRVDGTVVLFGAAVTVLAGVLFGLLPAVRASRAVPRGSALATGVAGRTASAGPRALRPQRVLVAVQVALSVTLLSAAALLTHSFGRLLAAERGFRTEGVLMATLTPGGPRYEAPEAVDAFYRAVLDRVRALPGVEAATSTFSPPLASNDFSTRIVPRGTEPEAGPGLMAGTVIVRDGYFAATGVPLLAGRDFDAGDRLGAPPVAIVNETMARTLWPGEDPLGRRFAFDGGIRGAADRFNPAFFPDEPFTVVGVAGDVRRRSLAEPPGPEYYRPHAQITWTPQYLLVRTGGDPALLAPRLREAVWEVDPGVAVDEVRTLASRVAEAVATPRFRMLLLGAFAGVTCLLAMVGLYAVMALAVARRTRELGIRLALGAERGALVRGVVAGGLGLVAAGCTAGLAASWAGSRFLASMLYEVTPTDPATYVAVAALTCGVALLACWAPAVRASRVDPARSLREE